MNPRVLAAGVAVLLVSACGGTATAGTPHHRAAGPTLISDLQACKKLRADILANGGTPDDPTLAYVLGHVNDARLAGDASSVIPDLRKSADVQGLLMSMDLASVARDCAPTGVQIPVPAG